MVGRPPLLSLLRLFGEDFVWNGVEVADGLHGVEGFEIGLNLRPLLGIVFGGDGGLRVGVEGDEVVLEFSGHDVVWIFCDGGQKLEVGFVGEGIAAGLDDIAGVEIAVGDVVVYGVVVGKDEA